MATLVESTFLAGQSSLLGDGVHGRFHDEALHSHDKLQCSTSFESYQVPDTLDLSGKSESERVYSSSGKLQVSPYPEDEHCLDLLSVDTQSRLLALALSTLHPATDSYATVTYEESFRWRTVFNELKTLASKAGIAWTRQSFYIVEFRSKLLSEIDGERLFSLDKQSHREATSTGGLLKYWYGSPDADRRNLATCLWVSKEHAINGGKGPWHKQARTVIPQMYESIDVKGLQLTIEDNIDSWSFQ